MQPIDLGDDFFEEMGMAGAPEDKKRDFLRHVLEVLQLRVGQALVENLTDEQAEDFNKIDQSDHHATWAWLEENCPQYKTIVADEFEALKRELLRGINKVMKATS